LGQTNPSISYYAQKLKEKGFLNEIGAKELLVFQPNEFFDTDQERMLVLEFLMNAFQREFYSRLINENDSIEINIPVEDELLEYVLYPDFQIRAPEKEYQSCIAKTRSLFGATRTRTLNELKELDLIKELTYEEGQTLLDQEVIRNEKELMEFCFFKEGFYLKYKEFKQVEIEYARALIPLGLINRQGFERLKGDYQAFELKKKHGILSYSEYSTFINLVPYPDNPEFIYGEIFKELKTLRIILLHFIIRLVLIFIRA